MNLGVCYIRQKNYREGIHYLEKAYETNPNDSLCLLNLAEAWQFKALLILGFQQEVGIDAVYPLKCLSISKEYLIKWSQVFPNGNNQSGKELKIQNAVEEILSKIFSNYLKSLNKQHIPWFLIRCYEMQKEYLHYFYEKNAELINEFLKNNFSELSAVDWNYLANVFNYLNQPTSAMTCVDNAIQYFKIEGIDPEILDTKADILMTLEKYKEANDLYNQVLAIDKDDFRVRKFYAETCWKIAKSLEKRGQIEDAKNWRSEAKLLVNTHSTNPQIKQEIMTWNPS